MDSLIEVGIAAIEDLATEFRQHGRERGASHRLQHRIVFLESDRTVTHFVSCSFAEQGRGLLETQQFRPGEFIKSARVAGLGESHYCDFSQVIDVEEGFANLSSRDRQCTCSDRFHEMPLVEVLHEPACTQHRCVDTAG